MIVGEKKDGTQESLHQFIGKYMSIMLSLPGPLLAVQMVTSPSTTAGYTHTFEI